MPEVDKKYKESSEIMTPSEARELLLMRPDFNKSYIEELEKASNKPIEDMSPRFARRALDREQESAPYSTEERAQLIAKANQGYRESIRAEQSTGCLSFLFR